MLNNKAYDALKWISITLMPTLVWALGILLPIYGVSDGITNAVIVTIGVVGTVIGALIGVSTISYNNKKKED